MRLFRRDAIGEKEPAWENRTSHLSTGPAWRVSPYFPKALRRMSHGEPFYETESSNPLNTPSGAALPVILTVANAASPNTATLAVQ